MSNTNPLPEGKVIVDGLEKPIFDFINIIKLWIEGDDKISPVYEYHNSYGRATIVFIKEKAVDNKEPIFLKVLNYVNNMGKEVDSTRSTDFNKFYITVMTGLTYLSEGKDSLDQKVDELVESTKRT